MNHLPVNHPSRPFWRILALLVGAYILVFGILGFVNSRSIPFFAQPDNEPLPIVLGLPTNGAFSVLSIVVGAVLVAAGLIGRNMDHVVNMIGGVVFLLAGLIMLALLRSDLNLLGFTMTTCLVSFAFGLVMLTAGLYCRVGTPAKEQQEDARRHRAFGSNPGVIGHT